MSDMSQREWDDRYGEKGLLWSVDANQFVARDLAGLAPGKAIDLGTGEGRNAVWLARRGWDVTAVDFSKVALEKARELAALAEVEIDFRHADVADFEPDASVDLVLLSYLQLGNPARSDVLRRVVGWLSPGATVFVVAHDKANVTDGYGGPGDIDVCYDLDETVRLLRPLVVLEAEVAVRLVHTDDGSRNALDTVVMARRPA